MTRASTQRRQNILRRVFQRLDGGSIVLGVMIGILIFPLLSLLETDVLGFLQNLVPEAVGIVFTVFILDQLDAVRENRLLIEQLIRRVHSRYNHTALQAIEELRVLGHLEDGTLSGKELRGSNWQGANLYRADLRGTDLRNANLQDADFVQADLRGAKVTDEQLASASYMHGATLPNGARYDGRYNLPGDFEYAQRSKVDIDSPEEMAEWYEVSLEVYLRNQHWAEHHLKRIQRRQADNVDGISDFYDEENSFR